MVRAYSLSSRGSTLVSSFQIPSVRVPRIHKLHITRNTMKRMLTRKLNAKPIVIMEHSTFIGDATVILAVRMPKNTKLTIIVFYKFLY